VARVIGQDGPQVPRADDQHPVGDFGPDGAHEPLCKGIRPWTSRRDLHHFDADVCQDRVERCGELPGAVADQEPEVGGAVAKVQQKVPGLLGGPGPVRVRGRGRGGSRSR
jgi:hypothetical protein